MAHTVRSYFLYPLLLALPLIIAIALLLKVTVLLSIGYTY